jgi:hypothetical protein
LGLLPPITVTDANLLDADVLSMRPAAFARQVIVAVADVFRFHYFL